LLHLRDRLAQRRRRQRHLLHRLRLLGRLRRLVLQIRGQLLRRLLVGPELLARPELARPELLLRRQLRRRR
jgi:hypothetical protein